MIEAASRVERTQLAAQGLERLAEATSIGDSDWGLGVLARSRALLSEGEDAERSGKLEIRSRYELATALPKPEAELIQA